MLTDSGASQVMSLAERARSAKKQSPSAPISTAPRWNVAGALDRGAAAAWLRHRDADGRMRAAAAEHADIERGCSCRCAGPNAASAAFESAPDGYMLFGIVQGGDVPALRHISARKLVEIGFHGYRSRARGR